MTMAYCRCLHAFLLAVSLTVTPELVKSAVLKHLGTVCIFLLKRKKSRSAFLMFLRLIHETDPSTEFLYVLTQQSASATDGG